MYLVVRKDVALTRGQAMAAAGAAAVRCVERFETAAEWREHPRKVALRAGASELEQIRASEAFTEACDGAVVCLPPRRRSERSELLESLVPFTDAPRPKSPPDPLPDEVPAMLYVVRPGVIKTAGKAMAQAGHAALASLGAYGDRELERFAGWRRAGLPGEVATAEASEWAALRELAGAAVVTDAGHTQVAPGTETVIALVPQPRAERPPLARSLPPLA